MVEDLEFILKTGMNINSVVLPLVQGLGNGKENYHIQIGARDLNDLVWYSFFNNIFIVVTATLP